MAKTKNKKKNLAEYINKRRDVTFKKKLNPFEVHINKEKMLVLGQKLKNDRGLPGVSRAKAIKKRKETLLQEYKHQNKSNKFTDRRIGEKQISFTDDDKTMARFTAMRMKQHKKSIFNLADDEVLTHRGQSLAEIEKFDDPRSDDEDNYDENDKNGQLDRSFVQDAHFGGGVLTKTGKEGARTHKELIEQLITDSKRRKAEKQKLKEVTLELTEKLDSEWKDLLPIVSKNKKAKDDVNPKPTVDDYDKVMRQLVFEARGTVSDRLKSAEELAKEEMERLEKLERERQDRMKGFTQEKKIENNHRSADDLDDDYVFENVNDEMLTYNEDGEANVKVFGQINGKIIHQTNLCQDENVDIKIGEEEEEEEEEDDDDDDEEDENAEDNLSDLKASSSEESDEETEFLKKENITNFDNLKDENTIQKKLSVIRDIMEKAREELPYTFVLPKTYDELQAHFSDRSPIHQAVIIERILKCHHPTLGKNNREGLENLFAFLLQHLNDTAIDSTDSESIKLFLEIFNALAPKIHELAQLNSMNAFESLKEVIKEKHLDYRKTHKKFPGIEMLFFFKLISILFSTSDFRHPIITPCFVFMEQILNKCKIKTRQDIAYGIFIVSLILEYTVLSNRFLPAAINYLAGILHMAVPKVNNKSVSVSPPFKCTNDQLVLLESSNTNEYKNLKMELSDLVQEQIDDDFKIRTIYITIKLLQDYNHLLSNIPSNVELFSKCLQYLNQLPIDNYPIQVIHLHSIFINQLNKQVSDRNLEYIMKETTRSKALRLYEPKIEEVFDGKSRKMQSKEKSERDKLVYKLRKETKGALREIRRDRAFLGRVKLQQKAKGDQERREKVKRIYRDAAVQQSELNSLDRQNKKKSN